MKSPRCIAIAGQNGAGKTTFAREYLRKDAGVIHFVNADLIAAGLSPLRPELPTLAGGRLRLKQLDRLAKARTVPRADVPRRFVGGWRNFGTTYKLLAQAWAMHDDPGSAPQVTGDQTMKTTNGKKPTKTFAAIVGHALPRAGQTALKTAPTHGSQP
jgi:hypothetical protein